MLTWLTQSLRFWEFIAYRGTSFNEFASFFIYLLPNIFMVSFPFSILLSVILLCYKIINDNEKEIISCCGVGDTFFAYPCFLIGALGSALLYFISIELLPTSFQIFREKELMLKHKFAPAGILPGQFVTLGKRTIYAKSRIGNETLYNVIIFDATDSRKHQTTFGECAKILTYHGSTKLLIYNGAHQEFPKNNKEKKPSLVQFKEYTIDIENKKAAGGKKLHESSITELINPPNGISKETHKFYKSELLYRLIFPLMPLVYTLLASYVMLSSTMRRRGKFIPVIIAIATALFIQLAVLAGVHPKMPPFMFAISIIILLAPAIIWFYKAYEEI